MSHQMGGVYTRPPYSSTAAIEENHMSDYKGLGNIFRKPYIKINGL